MTAEPRLGSGESFGALIVRAIHLTQEALDILDQACAPADIGAHINQAIIRLEQLISSLDDCGNAPK